MVSYHVRPVNLAFNCNKFICLLSLIMTATAAFLILGCIAGGIEYYWSNEPIQLASPSFFDKVGYPYAVAVQESCLLTAPLAIAPSSSSSLGKPLQSHPQYVQLLLDNGVLGTELGFHRVCEPLFNQ